MVAPFITEMKKQLINTVPTCMLKILMRFIHLAICLTFCSIITNAQYKSKDDVKVEEYGIKRLPAVAIDGQLSGCCKNNGITKDDLINAGITEKL